MSFTSQYSLRSHVKTMQTGQQWKKTLINTLPICFRLRTKAIQFMKEKKRHRSVPFVPRFLVGNLTRKDTHSYSVNIEKRLFECRFFPSRFLKNLFENPLKGKHRIIK